MRAQYRIIALTLICCFTSVAYQCFAQDGQKVVPKVSKLHFKSGIHQTFDQTPSVQVWSFTADYASKHGAELTLTGVKNWSSKTAIAVKVSWYLTRNGDYTDVLRTGQTKLITLGSLAPGEDAGKLKIPVVTSVDILRSLEGEIPEGDLFVGIQVSEIHFADGSIWKESRGEDRERAGRTR